MYFATVVAVAAPVVLPENHCPGIRPHHRHRRKCSHRPHPGLIKVAVHVYLLFVIFNREQVVVTHGQRGVRGSGGYFATRGAFATVEVYYNLS